MPAGEHYEPLRFQCPLIGSQSFVCDRQMIIEGYDHHQRRRADVRDVRARFVLQEHLDRTQRDLIAPGRRTGASGFSEPLPRVRSWQHGRPHWVFRHHGYHARWLALIARPAVLKTGRLHLGDKICADQPPRIRVSANQRHLSDNAFYPPIDRADHENMGSAVT